MNGPSSESELGAARALYSPPGEAPSPRGLWEVLAEGEAEAPQAAPSAAPPPPLENAGPEDALEPAPAAGAQEVELLIAEAEAQGFEAGLAQGRAEGISEAERSLREDLAAQQAQAMEDQSSLLHDTLAALAREQLQLRERFVAEAVDLALVVAEELAGATLVENPARLVERVATALAERECDGRGTLFLHPDDYKALRERAPEIAEAAQTRGASMPGELRFAVDAQLELGSFRLEDDTGGIDGSLATVLGELRNELRQSLLAARDADEAPGDATVNTAIEAAS